MRFAYVSSKMKPLGALLVCLGLLSGCETVQFYRQAVWGQWQLLQARTSVEHAIEGEQVSAEVAVQLQTAQAIISFAETELGLAAKGRYSSFVPLQRDYVVWNVFAAPPYSVEGAQWCYPFVGCTPYRGYFNESMANKVAQKYQRRGLETYVGGVPAYSTLGWFEDPLLSTFIQWPEADLANLLIHELAHSRVWVKGDATFNESFAEFVGNRGTQAWLQGRHDTQAWQEWLRRRAAWQSFRRFLLEAKALLQSVYQAPPHLLEQHKTSALAQVQACYAAHRHLLGAGRYDKLMATSFNNAFLVSVGTYADDLPAFAALFTQSNQDWPTFFAAVETLAELAPDQREARVDALIQLQKSAEQEVGHGTDDHNPNQVYCEAFGGHGAYGEASG